MDLFMEKPVSRDKLRAMLDLLESDSWQRGDTAADSDQPQRVQQKPLPGLGFAGGQRCNSLSSFSGGLDIKVLRFAMQKHYPEALFVLCTFGCMWQRCHMRQGGQSMYKSPVACALLHTQHNVTYVGQGKWEGGVD